MKIPKNIFIALFASTMLVQSSFGDSVVTLKGEELQGRIIEVTDSSVTFVPVQSQSNPQQISKASLFMLKYNDGRKEVFPVKRSSENDNEQAHIDFGDYSASIFLDNGLFGLVNINEQSYDAGVYTIGLTPSIDRRINRFVSLGVEYMILWAKPKKASDSRFLMNCNGMARLAFPINHKFNFLAHVNAGLSLWPGSQSVYPSDSTFFKDRIGWDFHGGLGVEYKMVNNAALVFYAGYVANFSTLDKVPITMDMLIVSIGPKIRF